MTNKVFNTLLNHKRGTRNRFFDIEGNFQRASFHDPITTYHPTTHQPLGIFIQAGRTRILEDNNDFEDSDWTQFEGATVSDRVSDDLAPSLDSWNINDVSSGQASRLIQQKTIAAGTETWSSLVFIKRTTGATVFPAILFELLGGSPIVSIRKVINTNTGEFGSNVDPADAGTTTATIRDDLSNDEWIAVQLTAQNNASGNVTLSYSIYPAVSDGTDFSATYTGTHRFASPSAEQSTFSSSPLATGNSPLTVASDFYYRSLKPSDYTDSKEWTFFVDFVYPGSNDGYIVSYRNSLDLGQRVQLRTFSDDTCQLDVVRGAVVTPLALGSLVRGQRYKIGVRIKQNDVKVFTNGSDSGSLLSVLLPTELNVFGLGCDTVTWADTDVQDMTCRKFQEWPIGLSDAELTLITRL